MNQAVLLPSQATAEVPAWSSRLPALRVRVFADSFIPWRLVGLPVPGGTVGVEPSLLGLEQPLFVEGDGRRAVGRSAEVQGRFRTAGMVEFDLAEAPGESCLAMIAIGESANQSRLELTGAIPRWLRWRWRRPIGALRHTGKLLTQRAQVRRLGPGKVEAEIAISGRVPMRIAACQPTIDYYYRVVIEQWRPASHLLWSVHALHDGFPGHEFFLECNGQLLCRQVYEPEWLGDLRAEEVRPSLWRGLKAALALAGVYRRQRWKKQGGETVSV